VAKRKQRGNGEGSIYEHKRGGKKVGYRGAYTIYTASGPKRRYVTGRTREEAHQKLNRGPGYPRGLCHSSAYSAYLPEVEK
jgi:hypothetical protein